MIAPWIIAVIVSAVISVAAVIIMPKPKAPKPPAVQQAEAPTASAGKPVPWIWGTVTIMETNVLWDGLPSSRQFKVAT